jgi:hypothetical protein
MDYSHVNILTKSFNSKLLKLAKAFSHVSIIEIVSNRLLFTKHGLYLNESGKELLSIQLALHIFSLLEEVNSKPIILRWYDKKAQVSVSLIIKPSQAHNCLLATEQTRKVCSKVLYFLKECLLPHIVVMLLDNAPSHPSALSSDSGLIIVEFLPFSVTP